MSVDPALLGHIEIETSDAMEQLGFRIGEQLEAGDLLILTGPLGACLLYTSPSPRDRG